MNSVTRNVKERQKICLLVIGISLKVFPVICGMTQSEFCFRLAEELNLTNKTGNDVADHKIEHYMRDGLPLPEQTTHNLPIDKEKLCIALEKIFNSQIENWKSNGKNNDAHMQEWAGDNGKNIPLYTEVKELIFGIAESSFQYVYTLEKLLPFATENFLYGLVSHLLNYEAWPNEETVCTKRVCRLLKKSTDSYPSKKLAKMPQPNVSVEDLLRLLPMVLRFYPKE